jgi:hypothetical protein
MICNALDREIDILHQHLSLKLDLRVFDISREDVANGVIQPSKLLPLRRDHTYGAARAGHQPGVTADSAANQVIALAQMMFCLMTAAICWHEPVPFVQRQLCAGKRTLLLYTLLLAIIQSISNSANRLVTRDV